jgi:catalase
LINCRRRGPPALASAYFRRPRRFRPPGGRGTPAPPAATEARLSDPTRHAHRDAKPPPPSGVGLRLAAIGLILLAAVAAFAWTGGWLSPERLTQTRVMAAFAAVNGVHPGFRRNHAKGLCATGRFEGNGRASALSTAAVFKAARTPVVARFSLAGGMPFQPDDATTVRALALSLEPAGGAEWRTGMLDIPVFPVNSAAGFYDQLLASRPDPATGKPDPARMKAFVARRPETARALPLIKARTISAGFADARYNGLNAFLFVGPNGVLTPVRWSFIPEQAQTATRATGPNYLFDDLIDQIRKGPLRWRMIVTVGEPGDPTADATRPWPATRRTVDAGLLTLDRVQGEDDRGRCTDITYDPLVLPPGIRPSDDPLLSARSSSYARSYTLRGGERNRKAPSAVQVPPTPPERAR